MSDVIPKKIGDNQYQIDADSNSGMKVPVRIYADEPLLQKMLSDRTIMQARNVASIPGIVGQSIVLPDGHEGYGFPVGGVAAMDAEEGMISPGGVGYDINCGVRLLRSNLTEQTVRSKLKELVTDLFSSIPSGVGSKGAVKLSHSELDEVLVNGVNWAIDHGYGSSDDSDVCEENGQIQNADPNKVSDKARKRGAPQLGSLGSGNHFLELQVVDSIVDQEAAKAFGLRVGQVCAMIHTGSRGLGHQVCSEHVAELESYYRSDGDLWHSEHWDISLPDRQLAAAPFHSKEGQSYFEAMRAAGNFAFANRSALTQRLRENLARHLGNDDAEVGVVYDVCHNIAKVEEHVVHGSSCTCCVHRKGATRALGGTHTELSSKFQGVGQPVLIPGDMGTASWVLAGPKKGANEAFSSSCHGAGRQLSRTAARKSIDVDELRASLENKGIHVHTRTPNVLAEEAPQAYKDVDEVIRLTAEAGLARQVARLVPFAVIKG